MCDLNHLPSPGLWAVQETHLTSMGIRKFKDEMRWAQSRSFLSHGHPVEPKTESLSTIGGKHSGVAFLSEFPIRGLAHNWQASDFETGRCHVAASFVHNQWIHAGTVYGYANQACRLDVQQQTDQLLTGLTQRIVDGAIGPRFIAGDWNLDREFIPQAEYWESRGWKEAQIFAWEKWGHPIRATCKNTSVKDFLYLSPEIQPFVKSVEIDNTICPDHAVIIVQLESFGGPEPLTFWRKPVALPWKDVGKLPDQHSTIDGTPDQKYRQIFEHLERRVDDQLKRQNVTQLQNIHKGRAATVEVEKINQPCAPIKQNRKGDIQTDLPFSNLQHSRWTRQARRLQHLTRAVCSEKHTADIVEHLANLWGKIRNAIGFAPSFPEWWRKLRHQIQGAPPELPLKIPTPSEALSIFQEFQLHYRALEKTLKEDRISKAKDRRKLDHLLIYQDLQQDRAEPVVAITKSKKHKVVRVTDSDKRGKVIIELDSPVCLGQDLSIEVASEPIVFQPISPTRLETNESIHNVLGTTVTSSNLIGRASDIIAEFNQEWSDRWQATHPFPENWEPIVDFAKIALPNQLLVFPPIDRDQWRKATRGKKAKSATGPDGVSKLDLSNLPDDLLDHLLSIIQQVEQTGVWPTQMLTGIVAALAKHPAAATVQEFRPITVLSMSYRVWATIRAKQCLRAIAKIAPHSIQGNLPGCSPKHVWYHLQMIMEHAQSHHLPLAGMILDIVKCFNMLPRQPLLEIGINMGLPTEVIRPWAAALGGLQRRFQIRGSTGGSILSSSGFPEGCPLSVVAMAITNLVCERWMYHRFPKIQTWSFVDNIETIGETAQDAVESFNALNNFCGLLDLEVDTAKSFVWANNTQDRAELRQQALPVQHTARDLGGQMNYTRYTFNNTVTQKIAKLRSFWKKLARSCAPRYQKLRSLKVSAWPNIFYSISTVTLGTHHFVPLRTQATKATNLHQYGSNPMLQMSCVGDTSQDPEFWCLYETIKSFRKYHIPEIVHPVLQELASGAAVNPGPYHATLKVLHKLAWQWESNGNCVDHQGLPINILSCPIQELYARTKKAWQTRVFSEIEQQHQTMQGLAHADADITTENLTKLDDDEQGLLRCTLNGTLYTNDALYHAGKAETKNCDFCGAPDSVLHRHSVCPFFEDIWHPFVEKFEIALSTAPECTVSHGWMMENPNLTDFKKALQDIDNTASEFFVSSQQDMPDIIDIFTDGGCLHPTESSQRIATWGTAIWNGDFFQPLSSGGVPGWHQTSLRGEIWAMVSALQFVALTGKPARLWTDNKTVFDRTFQYLTDLPSDWSTQKDGDLWHWLYHQLRQVKHLIQKIVKVTSHLDPSEQNHDADAWAIQGNITADHVATQARNNLDPALWQAWNKVVNHNLETRKFRDALHHVFVQIGKRAVHNKNMQQAPKPVGFDHQELGEVDPGLVQLANTNLADIPAHFQTDETPYILRWLERVTTPNNAARWISWHQMLLLYQLHTGRRGPRNLGRRWRSTGYHQETIYTFPMFAKWFSHYIVNVSKALSLELQVKYLRTPSHVITYWCGCLRIVVSQADIDVVDDFIRQWATNLPARNISRDLQELPVVSS